MSIRTLQKRLEYAGGDAVGRINKQKLYSFHAALKNDYNSRLIRTPQGDITKALINLNNLKPDYDKQIVSVDFAAGLKAGDVFEVLDNHTFFMIYLPDLVETAYLKSEIIRCRYNLEINGRVYWVYFQGPTETDIRWNLNHGMTFNELNWSGTIFIEDNEDTRDYFHRFKRFKIDGHNWETQVVDHISVPGVLEVEVQEYFDDAIAELPVIRKEQPEWCDDEEIASAIYGKNEVKRSETVGYSIPRAMYKKGVDWEIVGNKKVHLDAVQQNGIVCSVKIDKDAVGSFEVIYDKERLHVEIDTTESIISGDNVVYPYSVHEYNVCNIPGEFVIESPLARIIEQRNGYCKVEIKSGRSGHFTLLYRAFGSGEQFELPIKIKSL